MSSDTFVHRLFQEKPSTESRTFSTRHSEGFSRSRFRANRVINSRYTWYNFLLLNIIEQFCKPLNLYFLGVGLLQLISIITPVHPASTLVPLAVAFLVTALKDGYDDLRVHLEDARANAVPYFVLRKSSSSSSGHAFVQVRSDEIHVGDIVILEEGQEVSADVIMVATSNTDSCAYITTANLDGEIDLKERYVPAAFLEWQDALRNTIGPGSSPKNSEDFALAITKFVNCRFEAAPPDDRVQDFGGAVEAEGIRCALSAENMLLASTTVKNTRWLVAVVVYTGCETKVAMCRISAPVKWARLDRTVSRLSIYVFSLQMLVLVCFGTTGALMLDSQASSMWFLRQSAPGPVDYIVMPARFFLLTSVMIPISFKVMLDVSKLWVAQTIAWDVEMEFADNQLTPDEATRCTVNNTAIAEDLGQVAHVLTDKTGTLTQNVMLLRGVFLSPTAVALSPPASTAAPPRVASWRRRGATEDDESTIGGVGTLHISSTIETTNIHAATIVYTSNDVVDLDAPHDAALATRLQPLKDGPMGSGTPTQARPSLALGASHSADYASRPLLPGSPREGTAIIPVYPPFTAGGAGSPTADPRARGDAAGGGGPHGSAQFPPSGLAWRSRAMLAMFRHLAICHTVTVEETRGKSGEPKYRAASPDEESLVLAAARAGVVLLARTRTSVHVDVCGVEEVYTIEDVLPFTSTRKRMSIIVSPANAAATKAMPGLTLLMKGADDRTIGRVNPVPGVVDQVGYVGSIRNDDPFDLSAIGGSLKTALNGVANSGLRTLVHAQAAVDPASFAQWRARRATAEASHVGDAREIEVARLCCELEQALVLVGATAIEDRLQDGVPRTIKLLQQAGIVVWMLTGDKKETAREIALSANLAQPERGDRFVPLVGDSLEAVRASLDDCLREVGRLGGGAGRGEQGSGSSSERVGREGRERDREKDSMRLPPLATQTGSDSDVGDGAAVGGLGSLRGSSVSHRTTMRRNGSAQRSHDALRLDSITDTPTTSAGSPTSTSSSGRAVILLGTEALPMIVTNDDLRAKFLILAQHKSVGSVVCFRMTPAQKASVVKLVKETGSLTLAIGDGGNDCAMLREAHVGVGLRGREGRQAARSADYAVGQFRFLEDLLLVHGHWAYHRTAYIVQYSYYKSMFISFTQLCFNVFTGVSGNAFWDSIHLTMWNGAFTVPNILGYVIDRDVPRHRLIQFPVLYQFGRNGLGMTRSSFVGFLLRGVFHAVLLFALTVLFFGSGDQFQHTSEGRTMGYQGIFVAPYFAAMIVQSLVLTIESFSITWINWVVIWCISPLYLLFIAVWMHLPSIDTYGAFGFLFSDPTLYFAIIAMTAAAFIPLLAFASFKRAVFPDLRSDLHSRCVLP